MPFDTRCFVHGFAESGVVETLIGPHVPDQAFAAADADANAQGREKRMLLSRFLFQVLVQARQTRPHLQSRAAGAVGMVGHRQGGVPERHDLIADILVDRSPFAQGVSRHRRQETV